MQIDSTAYYRDMIGDPKDFDRLLFFKNVNELLSHSAKEFASSYDVQWAEGKKTFKELKEDVDKTVASQNKTDPQM